MPKVSIIIPVRYRADLTEACIDSVIKYCQDDSIFNCEVILVQEGVDSVITTLLENYVERFNGIKFVQNKIPKGFAGAMNTGLALAAGDYYCFLNNDTVVVPGWMDEMLKAFEDPKVGLVSPTFAVKTIQNVNHNKGQDFDYVEDPLMLVGTCFLVKKEVMDKIGLWDESISMGGGEDNDLCVRIIEAGYKLVVARKSFIYHYGSASFRELYDNNVDKILEERNKNFASFQKKYNGKYQINPKDTIVYKVYGNKRFISLKKNYE